MRFKPGKAPRVHSIPVDKHGRLKAFISLGYEDQLRMVSAEVLSITVTDIDAINQVMEYDGMPMSPAVARKAKEMLKRTASVVAEEKPAESLQLMEIPADPCSNWSRQDWALHLFWQK